MEIQDFIDFDLEGDVLVATASFSEDSNTGYKISTDVVMSKALEEGYDPERYEKVSTVFDKDGVETSGEWRIKLKNDPRSLKEKLMEVDRVGEKRAGEIASHFANLDSIEAAIDSDKEISSIPAHLVDKIEEAFFE